MKFCPHSAWHSGAIELKENLYRTDILSDDVNYHPTASCNPTSKKLESCNHCCVLGLLMYFENSHNLSPSILHKGSYDHKYKTCIFTMQIFKVRMFLAYQQKFLSLILSFGCVSL